MKIPVTFVPAVVLAAAVSLVALPASATPFTSMVVFGDSLSDGGNAFNMSASYGVNFPPSPPYNQRATNGLTAVEYLAHDYLGYNLKPAVPAPGGTPGTNYAFVGATTGAYTVPQAGTPITTTNYSDWRYGLTYLRNTGIPGQVNQFVAAPPAFNPATTLFTVFAGANDVFLAIDSGGSTSPNLSAVPGYLANAISTLVTVGGARHLFVPNLPNLGLTPDALAAGPLAAATLSSLALQINLGIATALTSLESSLKPLYPDLEIIGFDTYAALTSLVNAPPAGITNTTDACFNRSTGSVCANPDQYVFWDGVHPTAATHRILAGEFFAAIPEPGTYALFGVGLVLLGGFRSRRGG